MRESINIEEVGNYSMVFLPRVMMLPPLLPLKEMLPQNLESFSPPLCDPCEHKRQPDAASAACGHFSIHRKNSQN